jgi:hypothetical protein
LDAILLAGFLDIAVVTGIGLKNGIQIKKKRS